MRVQVKSIFISFDSSFYRRKPSLVGLGRPEVKPVERAMVDDRSSYELPKKPSRDEAGSSTEKIEQSAPS